MSALRLMVLSVVVAVVSFPPQWYPTIMQLQLAKLLGTRDYRSPPPSQSPQSFESEQKCPEDPANWRAQQTIAGVTIQRSSACVVDNPFAVAAFIKGTNNVSPHLLMKSGLTPDAVEKGRDLDGDGDPDEIHIRLEVAELNGYSPESGQPVNQFAIAPGISPGLWVFAPKMFGMADENFVSTNARPMLRLPSPSIRVEQGDIVQITLENTHYMPHTIHFHGVDHPFVDQHGEGNDGVPLTSEKPLMPGAARTYNLQPRQAGTMFYHCHVQPQVHIMMGLQGMFIVEQNRPNNWLQTLNVGAGHVRYPSVAIREKFDAEYDLQYIDIDKELNVRPQKSNDPRVVTQSMHRDYNITDAQSDYFTLNGKSFPYTFTESIIVANPDEHIKLRIVNGGSQGVALHTHGHKTSITHYDGVPVPPAAQITRDVIWIASAQRVDLDLSTSNDGLHSYGEGIWLLHDHQEKGITNNGIGPGGNVAAIVYQKYLNDNGWPKTLGVKWDKFFSAEYYQRKIPVWESYTEQGAFSSLQKDTELWLRMLLFAVSSSLFVGLVVRKLIVRS